MERRGYYIWFHKKKSKTLPNPYKQFLLTLPWFRNKDLTRLKAISQQILFSTCKKWNKMVMMKPEFVKLVPGCGSVAAERLKHHTVFYCTLLTGKLFSTQLNWLLFFYFSPHTVTWTVVTAVAEWVKEAQTPLKVWCPHSRFKIVIMNIKYMRWYRSPIQCGIRYLNEWPTLKATVIGCVNVSLSSWQSNASSSEKQPEGPTLKAAYSTHFTFLVWLGPLVAVLIIIVAKEGSQVK